MVSWLIHDGLGVGEFCFLSISSALRFISIIVSDSGNKMDGRFPLCFTLRRWSRWSRLRLDLFGLGSVDVIGRRKKVTATDQQTMMKVHNCITSCGSRNATSLRSTNSTWLVLVRSGV